MNLKTALWEYMLHKQTTLENEYTNAINRCLKRDSDPVDYLENIIAHSRLGLFNTVADDLAALIKTYGDTYILIPKHTIKFFRRPPIETADTKPKWYEHFN